MVLSCLCRENPTKSIPGYFEFGFFFVKFLLMFYFAFSIVSHS